MRAGPVMGGVNTGGVCLSHRIDPLGTYTSHRALATPGPLLSCSAIHHSYMHLLHD